MKKFWLLVATTMVVFTACEDDLGISGEKQSDKIGFNVELNSITNGEWGGRSNDSLQHSDVQLETLNETLNGKPVYLFTITNDSIEPNIKGDRKEKKVQSRGSIVTNGGVQDMGVSAWVYNGELATDWNDVEGSKLYIDNDKLTSPNWSSSHSWTAAYDRMRFYAYSPYDAVKLPTTAGTPTFEYTIADKVVDQKDLLVASSDVQCPNDYKPAPITFAHALTAVKFEVANNVKNLVVKAVRVKGVYYKGSYTYEYCGINEADDDPDTPNSDIGSWDVVTDTEAVKDYEITLNNIECNGDGTGENVKLNENEYVLLLMPQTLPAGAMVEIDVTDKVLNRDVTLKSSIAGGVWGKGKQVTYCISASDEIVQYVFETENVSVPDYYGGEGVFTVKSYKKTTRFGGERIDPVAWDVEDVIDNERNKTAVWMQELKGYKGNGVSNENDCETVRYQMGPAPLQLATSHWQEKRSHTNYHFTQCTEKGSYSNPFDLSTNGGANAMNTANCYIVGYAGHYKLPLVYGNAIGGGAYNGDDYFDHLNSNINYPWIDQRYTIKDAHLVWQDAPGLVSELRLIDGSDGHKYIAFEVKKEYACDGNALIAVRDGEDKIMWSWHIWVSHYATLWGEGGASHGCTDTDHIDIYNKKYGLLNDAGELIKGSTSTVKDPFNRKNTHTGNYAVDIKHGGQKFTMMSKYIGYCRGEEKYYGGVATIKFNQDESSAEDLNLEISSAAKHISTANNAVYYQFGRKDPFVGYGETSGNREYRDKTRFGHDGKPITTFKSSSTPANSIGETIQNPDVFYGAESDYWLSPTAGIREEYLWQAAGYTIPGSGGVNSTENRWNDIDYYTTSATIVRTLYDPCPVGYEMPRSDAFTGFLLDTKNPDKLLSGRPEEYKAYFVSKTNVWNSDEYTYVMNLPTNVEDAESNNNGNILREPNPCAFVSGYGEFGYWFRPDVNGAGKYNGTTDIFKDGEEDHKIDEVYKNCLLLMAMGCRGGDNTTGGSVREYQNMGNAMTATLVKKGEGEARPSRLYFFHKTTANNSYISAPLGWYPDGHYGNCRGHNEDVTAGYLWNTDVEPIKNATLFTSKNQIITVAASAFSLGFTILPAKSGANGVNIE